MAQEVCFDAALIERYGGRGPRYTSYPPASEFHDGFGPDDYRHHVAASNELPIPPPLSIYVHIPFCRTLCYYCGCNKVVTRNAARVSAYLEHLGTEMALQGALFDADRHVEQLHLGGGTPTYLSPAALGELLARLGEHFALSTDSSREFSIEIDPRTLVADGMHALRELGFNRVSLGVQDFDPDVQEAVNRIQPLERTADLVRAARAAAFRSVSFDLIYGLPLQSVASFERTLDQVLDLRPDRVAAYSYAHLPRMFKAQRLIRAEDLPPAPEKLDMLGLTIDRLTGAGYVYIGMDHFALATDELAVAQGERRLQRNFQGYSTHAHCDVVGLGASAIGSVGDCFAQNLRNTNEYSARLEERELAVARGIALDADDRVRAAVIQALMCHGEVRFGAIEERFGLAFRDYFAGALSRLDPMEHDGLVTVGEDAVTVTPRGRLLLRAVGMAFDRYLEDRAGSRFSKII